MSEEICIHALDDLPNRLVEVLAIVGVDDMCGLSAIKQQEPNVDGTRDLNKILFEPKLIAAISSQHAVFPFTVPPRDINYPPQIPTGRANSVGSREVAFSKVLPPRIEALLSQNSLTVPDAAGALDRRHSNPHLARRVSVAASLQSRSTVREHMNIMQAAPHLPVPLDVLQNLTTLCYPDGILAMSNRPATSVNYLILTNVEGQRSYATCLTYYRSFTVWKEDRGDRYDCSIWEGKDEPLLEEGQYFKYLPYCVVLISKYPYFQIMNALLSRLTKKLVRFKSYHEQTMLLKMTALQLTMIPVPPPGMTFVKFPIMESVFTIPAAIDAHCTVVDLPLKLVFDYFSVSSVLQILASILTQQKIVFLSSSYALLTLTQHSFLLMVEPFEWRFPFVPVLPHSMLELLEAPGALIMGTHVKSLDDVIKVEGLVVCNIDSGQVTVCPSLNLGSIPQEPATTFTQAAGKLFLRVGMHMEWVTPFTYEDVAEQRYRHQSHHAGLILEASIQLLVQLFRDILPHIKLDKRFFNRGSFLETVPIEYRSFYEQVLETQLFNQFLNQRFDQQQDKWSIMEERTRDWKHNERSQDLPLSSVETMRDRRRSTIRTPKNSTITRARAFSLTPIKEDQHILLPVFTYELYRIYFSKSIQIFQSKTEMSTDLNIRSSCTYLKAMCEVGNGQRIEALHDFKNLLHQNPQTLPKDVVWNLLSSLSAAEKAVLQDRSFFKGVEHWQEFLQGTQNANLEPHIMIHMDKLPNEDIDRDKFAEWVQMLEVAIDHDTAERLFRALTLDNEDFVDADTFKVFYEAWKQVEMECVGFNVPGMRLENNECFLKVSPTIPTSMGTGRLALTQKRLFLLREGSCDVEEVVCLRDITSLENILQRSSFFTQVLALRVKGKGDVEFIASLKLGRDAWFVLVKEMWCGQLMKNELRDSGILQQAAQNVLLIDAIIRSSEEEFSTHHGNSKLAISFLTYFTTCWDEGQGKLAAATKDVLQHCVDPNMREPQRRAIEALLYTPGKRDGLQHDGAHGPALWCAMGSGQIKVFDASTWLLQTTTMQAEDRIVCLLAVGNQVWAGSLDSDIYILDTVTKSCIYKLNEHPSMVVDLIHAEDLDLVYSVGIGGHVIAWDPHTLTKKKMFNIDRTGVLRSVRAMKYHDNLLYFCTVYSVYVTDVDGNEVMQAQFNVEPEPKKELYSMLITPHNRVWVGCRHEGRVGIFEADTLEYKHQLSLECTGIYCMVRIQDKIWLGTRDGVIYIVNMITCDVEKRLQAHHDVIRSMCAAQTRYVMTGCGSRDGKVAIWRTSAV